MQTGENRGSCRLANRLHRIGLVKPDAAGCERIETRCAQTGRSIAPQHVMPLRITHDQDDLSVFQTHGHLLQVGGQRSIGQWRMIGS
jgi:hypothetical protein